MSRQGARLLLGAHAYMHTQSLRDVMRWVFVYTLIFTREIVLTREYVCKMYVPMCACMPLTTLDVGAENGRA